MPSKKAELLATPEDDRSKRFHRMLGRQSTWPARARRYNLGVTRAGLGQERFRGPAEMAGQAWGVEPFQTPLQRATVKSDIMAQQARPARAATSFGLETGGIRQQQEIAQAQSTSELATAGVQRTGMEQTQRFAEGMQPTTLARGRVGLLSESLSESIAGLDAHIANLQAGFATAQAGGARPEDLQNYTNQIATAQTERQRLSGQIAGAGQLGQMPEQPLPQEQPQGFQFEAQPPQAGSRLNLLAGQSDRAGQEADIIMANTGLSNLLGTPEQPGMLASLEGLKPWDEGAIFTMQELLSRLQAALQQAQTPEGRQRILNAIRTNPAYAQIFQWQDADRPFSKESGGLLNLSPLYAGGRLISQIAKGQNPAEAAQLAQQIVSLVESAGNMPVQ